MSKSDPIADLLTKIRNAKNAHHRFVDFRISKIKLEIVKVFQKQGFIDNYLVDEEKGKGRLFLKYVNGRKPVLNNLKRKSCPSSRVYVGYRKIPIVRGGMGVAILSTPQGICDGKTARKNQIGGELICEVW